MTQEGRKQCFQHLPAHRFGEQVRQVSFGGAVVHLDHLVGHRFLVVVVRHLHELIAAGDDVFLAQ